MPAREWSPLRIITSGSYIYTPNVNAAGADSFSFKVNDGMVDSNPATVSITINVTVEDQDSDGIIDVSDNCILVANPEQRDTDGDGFGNYCDPDFDNTLVVNAGDLAYLKSMFFTADPHADLDGSGYVNAADLAILKSFFFKAPGPSGLVP